MHAFARRLHGGSGETPVKRTRGLVLDQGARYDLTVALCDIFLFRGQVRALRRRTIALSGLRPGEQALDVGCGTGTLALAIERAVGATGHIAGVDPGERQIARAQAKAARRHAPIEFQVGVIERLPFPEQTFDVVFSTLMMHHLPVPLKREGLAEIARVLKPGGRLVIADFTRKQERQGRARRFHAGGSDAEGLATLVRDAGFSQVDTEELRPQPFSAFPGAILISARKGLKSMP